MVKILTKTVLFLIVLLSLSVSCNNKRKKEVIFDVNWNNLSELIMHSSNQIDSEEFDWLCSVLQDSLALVKGCWLLPIIEIDYTTENISDGFELVIMDSPPIIGQRYLLEIKLRKDSLVSIRGAAIPISQLSDFVYNFVFDPKGDYPVLEKINIDLDSIGTVPVSKVAVRLHAFVEDENHEDLFICENFIRTLNVLFLVFREKREEEAVRIYKQSYELLCFEKRVIINEIVPLNIIISF